MSPSIPSCSVTWSYKKWEPGIFIGSMPVVKMFKKLDLSEFVNFIKFGIELSTGGLLHYLEEMASALQLNAVSPFQFCQ